MPKVQQAVRRPCSQRAVACATALEARKPDGVGGREAAAHLITLRRGRQGTPRGRQNFWGDHAFLVRSPPLRLRLQVDVGEDGQRAGRPFLHPTAEPPAAEEEQEEGGVA